MTRRIIALLVLAYPRGFRRRYADELRADILAQRRRAGIGLTAASLFWLRTIPDLIRTASRLRLSRRDGLTNPGTLHPRAALPGGGELVFHLAQDLKFAGRSLLSTPLATISVIATLTLAIGMNTAIFSVVDTVLLRPFDYRQPEELVYLEARGSAAGVDGMAFSGGMVQRLQAGVESITDLVALTAIQQNLTGVAIPEQVQVGWTTPNLFSFLGVNPALGRAFAADDPEGLVMLSHRSWQTTFAGDPRVVGRVVELDGNPYTIVGVVDPGFEMHISTRPLNIDIWRVPDQQWANGDVWNAFGFQFGILSVVGRMRPDTAVETVQTEIDAFTANIRRDHSEYAEAGYEIRVRPLRERVVSEVRSTLVMLLGAVVFVLLIACANVANLLLVRAGRRQREVSVRMALGSGRGDIVRLMLAESLLLAMLGGAAGLLLAEAGIRLVASMAADAIPRLANVAIDARILAFTLLVSLACPILFGLVPALRAASGDLSGALREAKASTSAGRHRATRGLAVAQISLSLVLLIGAGLLTASLLRLQEVPTGVEANDVLTFSVSLPGARYDWPAGTGRFHREFEERLETLPGVRAAGVMWPLPLSGANWRGRYAGGVVDAEQNRAARYVMATERAFETIGVPVRDGRLFRVDDSEFNTVISENLAELAFPGESPLGRTLDLDPWGRGPQPFEVIGVVADVRFEGLREPADQTVYFDARHWSWVDWEVDVMVQAAVTPVSLVDSIRGELAELDPEIPMAEVRLMTAYVDDGLAANRFALVLISLFATVAGLLALIGLYGVLSSAVAERTHEIGIRLALGSTTPQIVRMVVGSGMRLTLVGLVLGVGGAAALTRFLANFLYGVTATDTATYAAVSVVMLAVATFASYLPARRATRLSPTTVLRTQ